jgi:2-polyprenyl-3-methyl-5-hydroxy-6-metoxy-1,4-benzoquinol methylase
VTSFRTRSPQLEWMDTETISAEDFARCLADLAMVNSVTLARPPTIAFMRRVSRGMSAGAWLSVLDVGFGEGDMLRRVHRWGTRRGLRMNLSGVDLNPWSTAAAQAATPAAMGIQYMTGDLFDLPPGETDVVISSLFTHHLTDAQIVQFLIWMEARARRGWFVNDLHRHPVAYHGFRLLSGAAGWHRFVRHDGPISVARSFRRRDWDALLRQAGLAGKATVRWHVPFRLCISRIR